MLNEARQKRLISRLNKIEGQVRGIKRMVEEPAYCPRILNQVSAIRRALDSLSLEMIENHMNTCVTAAIKKNKGGESIQELVKIIDRFVR